MGVHQAQAEALISAAVYSMIRVSDTPGYARGSKPTAGFRYVHVAWDKQLENNGTRCLPFLVLELREEESGETSFGFNRVSKGFAQDQRMCHIHPGPNTRPKPDRRVSRG